MGKVLNDLLLREVQLADRLWSYRAAKVPDGMLTDELRNEIVLSLRGERDEIWVQIQSLCKPKE